MKTFYQWLEGRDDYNNPGVPWYTRSDTPAIRPTPPTSSSEIGFGGKHFPFIKGGETKDARQRIYNAVGVNSYRELPGKKVIAAVLDKPGTIVPRTTEKGINIKWDAERGKEYLTYPSAEFLKIQSP